MNQQAIVWAVLAIGVALYAASLNKIISEQKLIISDCSLSITLANQSIGNNARQIGDVQNSVYSPYLLQQAISSLEQYKAVSNPCALGQFIGKSN